MLISGIQKCERCGHNNEWEYPVGIPITFRIIPVDTYDARKVHPTKIYQKDDKHTFKFRCKYCDALNRFEYQYNGYGKL